PLRQAPRTAAGIAALAFVAIAVLRVPLLPTMLVLTPVSIWLASRRRDTPAQPRAEARDGGGR
ncbi:chromate transporter, partial [Burkholderia vietnamiensis]|nr:chromate transporter [Burkholderia vietnamiensis]